VQAARQPREEIAIMRGEPWRAELSLIADKTTLTASSPSALYRPARRGFKNYRLVTLKDSECCSLPFTFIA